MSKYGSFALPEFGVQRWNPSLPHRGRRLGAAETEEGRCGRERYVIPTAPAHYAPPQSGLRPASSTFYGIAATGSYARLDSLRDAPPGGEALRHPSRVALFYAFSTSAQKVSICLAMISRAPRQKFLSVRSMPATLAVSSAEATVVV